MKKQLNVLVIEDSEDDYLLIQRELRKGGFALSSERVDAEESLADALWGRVWDIVIADYSMPHLGGAEALKIVREACPDLPVIVVSGAIGEETAVGAMKAGANDYLMKGNLSRLVPAVEREIRDAGVRLAKRRADEEIRLLNRVLETVFEIGQLIVKETDGARLLSEACRILVGHGGFRMAWIGMADPATGSVTPVAHAGFMGEYIDNLRVRCDDTPEGNGPTGRSVRTGRHAICRDVTKDDNFLPWRTLALEHGYRSAAAFPIKVRGKVIGTVNVYSAHTDAFGERAVALLDDLAGNIGYKLQALDESAERRKAEAALRESGERFRQVFEQNEDSLMLIEKGAGRVIDANRSAEKLFGFTRDEFLKGGLSLIRSGETEVLEGLLSRIRKGEGFEMGRMEVLRKDGQRVIVSAKGTAIRLRQSGVLYLAFRDITRITRMEEEARLIQAKLIHANKMTSLGTLASGIAHEINNPNNFIMSNSTLLKDAWEDTYRILDAYYGENGDFIMGGLPFSEMRTVVPELLAGITEGARRIKAIVDSLKGFSRLDTSEMEDEFDVNSAVEASASILKCQIGRYTDCFYTSLGEGLPKVKGSLQKIEQVIINLVMNALHALPGRSSGVWVTTSYDGSDGTVVIKVKDEGAGMTKEVLDRITEPFFTTKADTGGTGLGLSISYSIVKEHKGVLEFESAPGAGTTATVKLPASTGR